MHVDSKRLIRIIRPKTTTSEHPSQADALVGPRNRKPSASKISAKRYMTYRDVVAIYRYLEPGEAACDATPERPLFPAKHSFPPSQSPLHARLIIYICFLRSISQGLPRLGLGTSISKPGCADARLRYNKDVIDHISRDRQHQLGTYQYQGRTDWKTTRGCQ